MIKYLETTFERDGSERVENVSYALGHMQAVEVAYDFFSNDFDAKSIERRHTLSKANPLNPKIEIIIMGYNDKVRKHYISF